MIQSEFNEFEICTATHAPECHHTVILSLYPGTSSHRGHDLRPIAWCWSQTLSFMTSNEHTTGGIITGPHEKKRLAKYFIIISVETLKFNN